VAAAADYSMKNRHLLQLTSGVAWILCVVAYAMPAQAAPDSFFDVFLESCQGPPYPTTDTTMANISVAPATNVPIATVAMKLNNLSPVAPAHMTASDPGGSAGSPGICSFFDVWLESVAMPDSFFDVFLEMAQPGGGAKLPLADTPTVVWHTDSFFDIYYELNIPGQGEQFVKMQVQVPEGQTVHFVTNPTLTYMAPDSFFDVFLEVASTDVNGQINPTLPLFRTVMTGSLGWPQPQPIANNITKFKQSPDASPRGLDVLAGPYTNAAQATMLADDFICTQTGPISDIHVWGSWLNDKVDPRATFWLGIWSDVPKAGTVPSHPGELLWWQQFSPGQYRSAVDKTVQFEQFYTPTTPPRVLGQDHQIWKYDFFPQNPFTQTGTPNQRTNYWLSVVVSNSPGKFFGWKTTPDHYNDVAAFVPAQLGPIFPAITLPWQVLPGPGQGKELAFMITTSQQQRWACNKTFYRPSLSYANVRVKLPGTWPISGFNGGGGQLPLFTDFAWDWDVDNNTVLDWTQPAGAGDEVHVGMEGPGAFPPFLNWGWWDPYSYQWFGWTPQLTPMLVTQWLPINTNIIVITNFWPTDAGAGWTPIVQGLGKNLKVGSLSVEYFSDPVPLALLNASASRSPLRTDVIPVTQPSEGIAPGGSISAGVPEPPVGANFAVVIPQVIPMTTDGQEQPQYQSTDWAMFPLTALAAAAAPPQPQVGVPVLAGTNLTLSWTAVPGTVYRVQSKSALSGASWSDAEGDVIAGEATASKTVSISGSAGFYRVMAFQP
jgi:hypothetical protein